MSLWSKLFGCKETKFDQAVATPTPVMDSPVATAEPETDQTDTSEVPKVDQSGDSPTPEIHLAIEIEESFRQSD